MSPRSDSLFPGPIGASSVLIRQTRQRSRIPLPGVACSPTPHIDLQFYEGDRPYLLIALLHLYGLLIAQVSSLGSRAREIYKRN